MQVTDLPAQVQGMAEQLKEVVDRCRRVETRVTKFLELQGFDTKTRKPTWRDSAVHIPSLSCALREVLETVPAGWDSRRAIPILHHGELVAVVTLPAAA